MGSPGLRLPQGRRLIHRVRHVTFSIQHVDESRMPVFLWIEAQGWSCCFLLPHTPPSVSPRRFSIRSIFGCLAALIHLGWYPVQCEASAFFTFSTLADPTFNDRWLL